MISEKFLILMAEDDEGHANLIQRNLKRAGVKNEIVHVKDGQEALDYIHRRGAYAGQPLKGPILMLLDIKGWDPERHRRLTGMEIGPVLAFARRLASRRPIRI